MNKETLLTYEELIEKVKSFPPGTIIPKPQSENEFTIKGLGRRRNEEALIYKIPTNKPDKYSQEYENGIFWTDRHRPLGLKKIEKRYLVISPLLANIIYSGICQKDSLQTKK